MKGWVRETLILSPSRTIRASLENYRAGGQHKITIIRKSNWVKIKNGQWMREEELKKISRLLPAPPETQIYILNGGMLLTGKGWAYLFYSHSKRRLTLHGKDQSK
jgi:hypothetical protein